MRLKLAVGAGAVLVLLLVLVIVLLPGDQENRPAASLTVPTAGELPDEQVPTSMTITPTFILPGAPTSSDQAPTSPSTTPSSSSGEPPPPARQAPPAPAATVSGRINFYGARNNDPPGSRAIAYTNVMHGQAGGTGTFDDPITFAAGTDRYQPGTKIYVPDLKRYFILEDLCPQCSGTTINVWTGSATDSGSVDCQRSLSRNGAWAYEVGPPAGRAVVAGDLYQNGRCFRA
ncbi:hypothetical protein [Kibdelosporangium aridum]|uniref:Uncharacterized protein n=1 Tax=Kibdelosporangium aridum TaxID=2030 RepID=A0A1W2BPU3_KIBAR|nr:hypothetical protein [Kibdelosporangium aridum]SMC74886.1 hypothetical protein SAMN05661093_01888 [Kibdelosporangium aridum]